MFLTISTCCFSQQPLLIPCPIGEKWGYCDTNGVLIIPADFDHAGYFTQKDYNNPYPLDFWYAPVRSGSSNNWIDATGKKMFPYYLIDNIECEPLNKNLRILTLTITGQSARKSALVDNNLKIIRPFEDAAPNYSDKFGQDKWVNLERQNNYYYESPTFWNTTDFGENILIRKIYENKEYQVICGPDGQTLVNPKFVQVSNLYENNFLALPPHSDQWFVYSLPEKIIDTFRFHPKTGISDGLVGACSNENGDCGFVNLAGKIVVPFRYKVIYGFKRGIALGQRADGLWDLLDTKGKTRFSFQKMEDIVPFPNHFFLRKDSVYWEGYDYKFKRFRQDSLQGPPLGLLREGEKCYRFKIDEDSVFLDLKGNELGRHSYDYINRVHMTSFNRPMTNFANLFYVRQKGKYGLVSRVGAFHFKEIAAPIFDQLAGFRDGYCSASIDGKWGVLDTLGQVIIPCKWDKAEFVYDYHNPDSSRFKVEQNKRIGICDLKGNQLVPCVLQRYSHPINLEGTKIWLDSLHEITYLCDGKGACKTFDSTYHFIYPFSEDFEWQFNRQAPLKPALKVEKGDKKGLLSATGEWIVPPLYYDCDITQDGKYVFFFDTSGYSLSERHTGKLLFNEKGRFRILFEGNDIFKFAVTNNQVEYSIWHPQKQVFMKPPFQISTTRGGFRDGMLPYYENYKIGFLDENMTVVIPAQFDAAASFQEGVSIVNKGGRVGVIDKTGHVRIPIQNEQVRRLQGNCLIVQKDSLGTWDLVNAAFETIYSGSSYFDTLPNNNFIIWSSPLRPGKRKLLDGTGKIIIPEADFIYRCTTGLAYLNNGVYFEHGVSPDQPLKAVFEMAKTYPINDTLLLISIPTTFDPYENLAYGVIKKDSTQVIPISKHHYPQYLKESADFLVSDATRKYAFFDIQGRQKTPYQFDYSPEFDPRAPFCYFITIGYTQTWITHSGRVICQKR